MPYMVVADAAAAVVACVAVEADAVAVYVVVEAVVADGNNKARAALGWVQSVPRRQRPRGASSLGARYF
jgi:hypothetical protein